VLMTRRYALTALAASALTTGAPWVIPGVPSEVRAAPVRPGAPAPAFTGTDTKGVRHALQHTGAKQPL
jgi:hypothetical protein